MGKGIKMRFARDRSGKPYSVEELQMMHDHQQVIPDLICNHLPCSCSVRFVPRYQQNRANRIEPIDVPAYIGLTSDSEHCTGCRYDANGQIAIIAAQSDPDFLQTIDDGKRELRLLLLHNGLKGCRLSGPASSAVSNTAAGTASGKTTTSFIQTDEKLSSYLRTTSDLVTLRALCESDNQLATELILRLGSKQITWSRFFFERERYDDAWKLVKTGSIHVYPIALAGVVKSHYVPGLNAKHNSSFLNCRSLYKRTDTPNRVEAFEVSIVHPDGKWLSKFPVGSEVVIFGLWDFSEAVEKQDKNTQSSTIYVTHKLILRPSFMRQVVRVD